VRHAAIVRVLGVMARLSVISLGVFMVLLLSAYFLAYFFNDAILARYRRNLEKTYNVNIVIHHSHLDGLTQHLEGVQVTSRGGAPLARIDEIVAPLHPVDWLFHGTSRFLSDMILIRPRVDLVLAADGRFNWDSVTIPAPKLRDVEAENYRGKVTVTDGFISLRDQRKGDYLGQFEQVEGGLRIFPDHSWRLQAQAEGGDIKLRGSSAGNHPIDLHVGWKQLALDDWLRHPDLLPYLRVDRAVSSGQVKLTFRPGQIRNTLALGDVQLTSGEVVLPRFGQAAKKVSGTFRLLGSTLVVEKGRLVWQGQPLKVSGQLRPGGGSLLDPYVKLRIQGGPVAARELKKIVPQLPLGQGRLQLDMTAEGPWRDASFAGRVQGWGLEVAEQSLRDLVADFELDRNSLHLKDVLAHTQSGEPLRARGYVFLDKNRRVLLRLSGAGLQLGSYSPWLAGTDQVRALALGTLAQPVLTGQAELDSLPPNPFNLQAGLSRFWLDPYSAFLWDGSLWGPGGTVDVPWAVIDYRNSQLAAGVSTEQFHASLGGTSAQVRGVAEVTGDYLTNQYYASGYMTDGVIQVPGLPALTQAEGAVSYQDGHLLVPEVQGRTGGDPVTLTGNYAGNRGHFYVQSPSLDPRTFVAAAPPGRRQVIAEANVGSNSVEAFKLATHGPSGDAWAVGRLLPGRGPEVYAEFVDAQVAAGLPPVHGQVATNYSGGRLNYWYAARPNGAGPESYLLGQGYWRDNQIHLADNFLAMPGTLAPSSSFRGEGRAYSYFGPQEGPPILHVQTPPEPWQYGGTLAASGDYGLSGGAMNLNIKGRNLNLGQLATWFGPLQDLPLLSSAGLTLEHSLLDMDARVEGTRAQPRVTASLRSPWTRVSRDINGNPESLALSWRGDARVQGGRMDLQAVVSPRPHDVALLYEPRGVSADWLRADLHVSRDMSMRGVVRSEAFPLSVARFLAPEWLAYQMPSGVLSTEGLQVSGTLYDPQLTGRVDLRSGRYWTGFRYLPIDEAFVDFASQQRATALSRFRLRSGGLTLEGRGNRTSDGRFTAQVWADDLPLDTLNDFGFATQGWQGTVDLAATLRDSRGMNPEAWIALEGRDLVPSQDGVFGVRRLVLGELERELDGIPTTGPGKGVHFRMEAGEMIVELPPSARLVFNDPQESTVAATGRLSWRALPQPRQTPLAWLMSANGPRFGRDTQPLQVSLEKFSWDVARQLLALPPDTRDGYVTGSVSLLGQWFEQHRVQKPRLTQQPLVSLKLNELLLEGPGAVWSGLRLQETLQAAYEVRPGAAWLRVAPAVFEFFRRSVATPGSATLGDPVAQGTLETETNLVVMESPGLKKAASKAPDQMLRAIIKDLPLQNLGFLFPELDQLGGSINALQLNHAGPLSQPQTQLTVAAQNLQVEGLNITTALGSATLESETPGQIRLTLGSGAEEPRLLLGGEDDLSQSLRMQGQAQLDFDRLVQLKSQSLVGVWEGWTVSNTTAFDLKAQLSDSQMRLLTALAPDNSVLGGRLSGQVELKGTGANPELTGLLALDGGSFQHPSLRTPVSGTNLLARFERIGIADGEPSQVLSRVNRNFLNRYTLEKFEGFLGDQPFSAEGKAEMAGLQPTFLDFAFRGEELPIQWEGLMDGRANVHLNLRGIPARRAMSEEVALIPHLSGEVVVPQATLRLPDEQTLGLVRSLNEAQRFGPPLSYDVDLRLGDDVSLNALGSSIRASGDLKVTPSTAGTRPALNGQLFLSRGTIRVPIYELTFRLRQGYANFDDNLIPTLDNVEADATLGNYQLTARVDGRYPDLRVSLVSNPPLPDADIRRLAGLDPGGSSLVNNPFSTTNLNQGGIGNNFIVNQGVSYLSNVLTSQITGGIGRLLFDSDIQFDILPSSEYVIRLAKALDEKDRFLLTFAQVIGTTRFNQSLSQYGLEWRFQPNLLTRVSLDNYGIARIWFQGTLRY
jgi:hypothetical protein